MGGRVEVGMEGWRESEKRGSEREGERLVENGSCCHATLPPSPPPPFLQELLKYTTEDHPDRPHVEAAVEAMRQVAMQINEQKRRMENIGKIGRWQEGIENWKVRQAGRDHTHSLVHVSRHQNFHQRIFIPGERY